MGHRMTYHELVQGAKSSDRQELEETFKKYEAWVRIAPQIADHLRLTQMECDILNQMFEKKGFDIGHLRPGAVRRR